MPVVDSITLYSDLLDYITALNDGGARTKDLRMHKEAILGAYRDLSMCNEWAYYMNEGRIHLNTKYNTGTIAYTLSSNTLTLSGGTWPDWTPHGRIVIADEIYDVESVSGANVTLGDLRPSANISSSTSYALYRTSYPLPDDMWRLYDVGVEANNWTAGYISPTEWQRRERIFGSSGQTWAWTIMKDPESDGRWSLWVDPYPDTAEPLMFIYRRKPRTLRWSGVEASVRTHASSGSADATTMVTAVAIPASAVGSIVRLSSNTDYPTGLAGVNPYQEQNKITAINTGTRTLTLKYPLQNSYSASEKVIVSDPVDMSENMIEALKAEVEYRLSRFSNNQGDMVNARRVADYQTRRALEAETRYATRAPALTRYDYLFTHLDGDITTSS